MATWPVKNASTQSSLWVFAHYNLLLDAEEVDSLHYTYGFSPDGESVDTKLVMSLKGGKVEPALETAMEGRWQRNGRTFEALFYIQ